MDRALLRLLRTRGHLPALEHAARVFARAGENGALWFAVYLGLHYPGDVIAGAALGSAVETLA